MPWVQYINKPIFVSPWADEKIRFIWTTDEHIQNSDVSVPSMNMQAAVRDCREWKPSALVSTGDAGNAYWHQVERWYNYVWGAGCPVYLAVGNHDESEYAPGSAGNPATDKLEATINRRAPFNYSWKLSSGDYSLTALCIALDCNFYADDPDDPPPGNSDNHSPGDRIGIHPDEPGGGYRRMFPQSSLDWLSIELEQQSADIVLGFVHYHPPTMTNYGDLVDVFQVDGRPTVFFCGHAHSDAKILDQNTSDNQRTYQFHKAPALLDCGAWCRVALSLVDNSIKIDEAELHNYTNPGDWTISAPFTVGS